MENSSGADTMGPPNRKPMCARCKNHSLSIPVRNHKNNCQYQYCVCSQCELVAQRQRIMSEQVTPQRTQDLHPCISSSSETLGGRSGNSYMAHASSVASGSIYGSNSIVIGTPPILTGHSAALNNSHFPQNWMEWYEIMNRMVSSTNILSEDAILACLFALYKTCGSDLDLSCSEIIQANKDIQKLKYPENHPVQSLSF